MKDISATEAARNFADLLDAVEQRGESFTIVRRGRPVARFIPAPRANGKQVRELLLRHRPDPDWVRDVEETRDLIRTERRPWND